MKYQSKPETVEAFKFTRDADVNSPDWFSLLLKNKNAFLDWCLVDGASRVVGCTILTKTARLRASTGDYIVQWEDGNVTVEPKKRFEQRFTERGGQHGN